MFRKKIKGKKIMYANVVLYFFTVRFIVIFAGKIAQLKKNHE